MSIHNPGDEKTSIYPFKTKNILPYGKEIIVKSHKHRKELMKQYNLHDDMLSLQTKKQRRRWYGEEKTKEKKTLLNKTWQEARTGKIDLRPYDLARRRAEYELRNGRIK